MESICPDNLTPQIKEEKEITSLVIVLYLHTELNMRSYIFLLSV